MPLKVGFKQCHKYSSSLSAYIFLLPWQNLDPLLGIFQTSHLGIENLFSNLLVHSINFIKCNHKKALDSIGCITPLSNPIFECQHNSANPSKRTQVAASHNSRTTTSFFLCFFCFPSIILSNFLGKEISSLPIYTL